MAARNTGDARFAYLSTADGLVPATPVWQQMALTSLPPIKDAKQTARSSAIRGDGNKNPSFPTRREVSGTLASEMSYAVLDDWLEGVLRSTWASDTMINGVTDKLFATETAYRPAGGGAYDSFYRHDRVKAGGITITIPETGPVTYSIPVMGIGEDTGTAIVPGATYLPPIPGEIISSGAAVRNVIFDGAPRCFRSITLTVGTNPRRQTCVDNIRSSGISHSPIDVAVSASAFFESQAEYDKLMAHTAVDLSFEIGIEGQPGYRFSIDKLRGNPDFDGGGEESDVTQTFELMAEVGTNFAGTLKVERAV